MLGEVKADESLQPLLEVSLSATDAELQRAALTAASAFPEPAIGERLLEEFANFSDEVRPAFFDLMLSRVEWTRQLGRAQIASGAIAAGVIPSDVVEQLRRHPDAPSPALATQQFGAGTQRRTRPIQTTRSSSFATCWPRGREILMPARQFS
jgi:hypothetical protein